MKQKYLVVIAGPTAVGKTALAIQLAKHYHSVILSADSRQFYKEMTIGTAKPSAVQLNEVKHYFIDTKNIDELYGAGHYEKEAIELINQLFTEKDILFVVGGSGLYIQALLNGVDDFDAVPAEVREKLNKEFEKKGLPWLQAQLKEQDPEYFATVDIKNIQRMIRALEVCLHTGKPYSSFLKQQHVKRDFTAIPLFINIDRDELYDRINDRTDQMIRDGLLDEVRSLESKKDLNALKTVGYKELFDYLEGKTELDYAINKIKQHTRNYAKRQITWFKNQGGYEEFDPKELEKITAYIDVIISHG